MSLVVIHAPVLVLGQVVESFYINLGGLKNKHD